MALNLALLLGSHLSIPNSKAKDSGKGESETCGFESKFCERIEDGGSLLHPLKSPSISSVEFFASNIPTLPSISLITPNGKAKR